MSEERFQVIVVGAGIAGCAAAYRLARAGHEVLLLERGKQPGCKNVSGGRLYTYALEALMPGEWHEAPLEREVQREMIMMMTENNAVTLSTTIGASSPATSFTVLRSNLDAWLAQKAEDAGAMLVTGIKADKIIMKNGKATGVLAGDEELAADMVVCADGVNSLLAEQAGLAPKVNAEDTAVGVKLVVGLPQSTINDRFNVADGQGAACLMVGDCTKGLSGGGFLYTNRESVSLGIVIDSGAIKRSGENVADLIERFKAHSTIAPLIAGGELLEYSAHLIPEGGLAMMPRLYGEGVMVIGDAAGFVVNSGLTVRGMDYAILSGIAAAETASRAIATGDYSQVSLKRYETDIRQNILNDMQTFKNAHSFMQSTPGLFTTYPRLAEELMHNLFTVNGSPAKHAVKTATKSILSHVSPWQLLKDGVKGALSI